MGIMRYNFRSEAIGMQVDVTITFPSRLYTYFQPDKEEVTAGPFKRAEKQYEKDMKLQTVYVLHGGGDDDTLIYRLTNLERYAEKNNVMTVNPQVKDSFFINTDYGIRYFDFITEELPVVIQSLFASSDKREDNFVIGMAMGGNAALAVAMKRPDLYAACVDLSGGIGCSIDTDNFIQQFEQLHHLPKFQGAFGDPEKLPGSEFDIGHYARKNIKEGVKVPELFLAVGYDDFIRDFVRKDRDALLKLGYHVFYEEAIGYAHDWDFWDLYVKKALNEWLPLSR